MSFFLSAVANETDLAARILRRCIFHVAGVQLSIPGPVLIFIRSFGFIRIFFLFFLYFFYIIIMFLRTRFNDEPSRPPVSTRVATTTATK